MSTMLRHYRVVIILLVGAFLAGAAPPVRYSDLYGAINIVQYGADPTGVADSTAAIQAAIDYSLTNNINSVFCPPGNYKTTLPIFFDPPGNLRGAFPAWASGTTYAINAVVSYRGIPWVSLANGNTGNTPATGIGNAVWWTPTTAPTTSFSYGASFLGIEGLTPGFLSNSCVLSPTFNNAVAMWAPSGNGDEISSVTILGPQTVVGGAGYHCGQPNTGAGFAVPGGNGGANRTKLINVGVDSFYYGIVTAFNVNGTIGLGAENKIIDPYIVNACQGVAILGGENFINYIIGGSVSAQTAVYTTLSVGVVITGGNFSDGDPNPATSFALTSVSAAVVNNQYVVTATITTPDAYLINTCASVASCAANVYNAFSFVTTHFGVVPMQMTSFNTGTKVATFQSIPQWLAPYANTCCGDLATELGNLSTVYAAEMLTTFSGAGFNVTGAHVENPGNATTFINSESNSPVRTSTFTDTFFNYDPSLVPPASPTAAQLAAFYAQQEFPFIYVGNVDTTINTVSGGNGVNRPWTSDYLMVDVLPNVNLTWHGEAFPLNIRGTTIGGTAGDTFTGDYSTINTAGLGGGVFDRTPFVSLAYTQADVFRVFGWQATPATGYRPAPWALPCISPSQFTVLQSLPAITNTPYVVSYPLIWGGEQYRLCDWSLGSPAHYGFISSHFGYSYGQNLTTTNVPSLAWSSRGNSPAVYINDTSLFFPGLSLTLTGTNGGSCPDTLETFMTTEVHHYLGYIRVENAGQDGSPYLPQWGSGVECTGATIGQAAYSFTNLN